MFYIRLKMRDKRLYRVTYGTFEDYCEQRWGMKRQRAYQLMEAAQVNGNLSKIFDTLPENDAQARELAPLAPDEQRLVWDVVQQTAPGGKVTAARGYSRTRFSCHAGVTGSRARGRER